MLQKHAPILPFLFFLHPSQDCAPHAMVGFVAGWRADQVSALPQEEVVRKYLEQLDRMFATPESSNPATATFAASKVRVCMRCVRIGYGFGVQVWGILSATQRSSSTACLQLPSP